MNILVGVPHRALSTLEVLVYDYDELGVDTMLLHKGDIFQPWEPRDHWRGEEVPITLGEGATQFDWGVTSIKGHFLRWDDFFERCAPKDAPVGDGQSRVDERSLASPFAHLAEMQLPDDVRRQLEDLKAQHTSAAMSELSALGFDNSEAAKKYRDEQKRILDEARELLSKRR